jgi:hypothetical protein
MAGHGRAADDESMGSRTGQLFGVGVSFGGVLAIVEAAEAAAPALGLTAAGIDFQTVALLMLHPR